MYTLSIPLAVLFGLGLGPGCTSAPAAPEPAPTPLELVRRGFEVRETDPLAAADLLARAPGTELERLRHEVWLETLEAGEAGVERWRAYLAASPPPELARRAEVGLGRALLEADEPAEAATAVGAALAAGTPGAAAVALEALEGEERAALARRLAVADPAALAGRADLEDRTVARLSPDELLERAARLRAQGRPQQAARELGRREPPPELAAAHRLELGRALVEAREPEPALAAVPEPASAAEWLVHARAHRRVAWNAWPREEAAPAFALQLAAAQAALAAADAPEDRAAALELVLEGATQTGALDDAWDAWTGLTVAGWQGERREWLGRRLGLALIDAGGAGRDRVRVLARALPEHERAFAYWLAVTTDDPEGRRAALAALASAQIPDLYAQWARADLGRLPVPAALDEGAWGDPLEPATPPAPVPLLLEWEEPELALREWRRQLAARTPGAAEALALAALEREEGDAWRAIRRLVAAFPALGSVELRGLPRNVVEAYLPLPWPELAARAGARHGLDPALLAGLARQESIWDADAVSHAGAVGLVQLMPATAARHARALGLGSAPDLTDPALNMILGARELGALLEEFGALEPALAGYNAGPNRVRRWFPLAGDARRFTEMIAIPETYTYVRRVPYLAAAYRALYGDALDPTAPEPAG